MHVDTSGYRVKISSYFTHHIYEVAMITKKQLDDYLENVSYYVENGDLYAYKPFVFYSIYGEENYFTDDSFEILVAESEKK